MAPPIMLIVVVPGAAVTIPPQVVVAAGELATVKPAPIVARLSLTVAMLAAVGAALESVIVSIDTWVWTTEPRRERLGPAHGGDRGDDEGGRGRGVSRCPRSLRRGWSW